MTWKNFRLIVPIDEFEDKDSFEYKLHILFEKYCTDSVILTPELRQIIIRTKGLAGDNRKEKTGLAKVKDDELVALIDSLFEKANEFRKPEPGRLYDTLYEILYYAGGYCTPKETVSFIRNFNEGLAVPESFIHIEDSITSMLSYLSTSRIEIGRATGIIKALNSASDYFEKAIEMKEAGMSVFKAANNRRFSDEIKLIGLIDEYNALSENANVTYVSRQAVRSLYVLGEKYSAGDLSILERELGGFERELGSSHFNRSLAILSSLSKTDLNVNDAISIIKTYKRLSGYYQSRLSTLARNLRQLTSYYSHNFLRQREELYAHKNIHERALNIMGRHIDHEEFMASETVFDELMGALRTLKQDEPGREIAVATVWTIDWLSKIGKNAEYAIEKLHKPEYLNKGYLATDLASRLVREPAEKTGIFVEKTMHASEIL